MKTRAPLTSLRTVAINVASVLLLTLAGCASPPPPTVNYAAPPAPPPPPPPPVVVAPPPAPAPMLPVPFDTAIVNAATTLFKSAGIDAARVVVIDPLIDGVSGQQTLASGLGGHLADDSATNRLWHLREQRCSPHSSTHRKHFHHRSRSRESIAT